MVKFGKNQKIIGITGCPSFDKIIKKMNVKNTSKFVLLDDSRQYIGSKHPGTKRNLVSPSLVEFGTDNLKVLANGTEEINDYFKKMNKFGNVRLEYAPMPGWGKFSASPGNDRAGNAISCKESGQNMCSSNNSEKFPKKKVSFGKELLESGSEKYYTKRGATGFDNLPKSIYSNDGNQVFSKNFSPYGGYPMSGILPRPYGPRDNAVLRNLAFGKAGDFGPFINQAYNSNIAYMPVAASNAFGKAGDFGPFINQAYNSNIAYMPVAASNAYGTKKKTKFGQALEKQIGFVKAKPLFRPHSKRNDNKVYQSIGNSGMYLPGYNPFQVSAFGNAGLYQSMGPNINEIPMLVYPVGLGGNTVNYFNNKDYYAEGKKTLKVQRHNNPTGFLSSVKVKPVSGLNLKTHNNLMSAGFGNPDKQKPWVMDKKQVSRPMTTNLFQTESAGFQRIAQPLELYTYQNTNASGYDYPSFMGPRMWMGGYGNSNKKSSNKPQKTTKKTNSKVLISKPTKTVKVENKIKTKKLKIKPGDTLVIKNGKVKVAKSKPVDK
jgi:hypothetical protein